MAKRLLVTFALIFCGWNTLWSTHIVGGEFELVHLQQYQYRLNLILYFDQVFGNPGAEDQVVTPFIFRKSDNAFMGAVTLNQNNSSFVPYTQPNCAIGDLVTRRIIYTVVINLPPELFGDPEGYYVAWERCCRNNFVSNINYFGQVNTVGQTFYLEFPPVVRDGEQFIDSTPILFPPLRD
jgi:hypothetical protein